MNGRDPGLGRREPADTGDPSQVVAEIDQTTQRLLSLVRKIDDEALAQKIRDETFHLAKIAKRAAR